MFWTVIFSFHILIQPIYLQETNDKNQTIIEALHRNVTVTIGQKAILTCLFDTTNDYLSTNQLIWVRQSHGSYESDSIIAHNQALLISDSRLNLQRTDTDYSLIINDVTSGDDGIYACEVNTEIPQKAFIYLSVQEDPVFLDNTTSSPIVINEYDNITLKCLVRGRNQPYVTWFRRVKNENNHTKIDNELLANNTDGQLHLINVSRYQSGLYQCQIANRLSEHSIISKQMELRVLFPPVIHAQLPVVQSTIGKSVHLRCTATVPYETKIYWQRMDNQTSSQIRSVQNLNNELVQTSLHLKDIDKHDFGFYACFAESVSGKNHAVVELRELRRSINASTIDNKNEESTTRIQILKRNKISDQTTRTMKTNQASTYFPVFYMPFIFIYQIICNLT